MVQLVEVDDGRHELVGDALDAVVANLAARGQGRRLGRLQRMHADRGLLRLQVASDAHHRAARAYTRDERVRTHPLSLQLQPDLGTGAGEVGIDVGLVGKLVRQEGARVGVLHRIGPGDGPEKAAIGFADEHDRRAEAGDQRNPLAAHPVGHEHRHRVSQRPADGGKRDPGVAARRFGNGVARRDGAGLVGALQDMQRHAVLDAAGQVEWLVLGVNGARRAVDQERQREQRRVADQPSHGVEVAGEARVERGHVHRLSTLDVTPRRHGVQENGRRKGVLWPPDFGYQAGLKTRLYDMV